LEQKLIYLTFTYIQQEKIKSEPQKNTQLRALHRCTKIKKIIAFGSQKRLLETIVTQVTKLWTLELVNLVQQVSMVGNPIDSWNLRFEFNFCPAREKPASASLSLDFYKQKILILLLSYSFSSISSARFSRKINFEISWKKSQNVKNKTSISL